MGSIIFIEWISLGCACREMMVPILLILHVFGGSLTQVELLLLTVVITVAHATAALNNLIAANAVLRHVVSIALVDLII